MFKGDNNQKLLKLTLQSDELSIVCRKGFFNYDMNYQLVQNLEKMTSENK